MKLYIDITLYLCIILISMILAYSGVELKYYIDGGTIYHDSKENESKKIFTSGALSSVITMILLIIKDIIESRIIKWRKVRLSDLNEIYGKKRYKKM